MKSALDGIRMLAFSVIALTACDAGYVQNRSNGGAVLYETILGRSLTDDVVADFLESNNCLGTGKFQVCREAGMDLFLDSELSIESVYLHLSNDDGYSAYDGELPFGLKFYDIQGAVEYKLKRQGVGNEGLPDEGRSPDHFHYWAFYREGKLIIIYNSPFPDEDATINAVIVSK